MNANEMLEAVRGSLEGWPDAGGDIHIAQAVRKIEFRARISETERWRTHFHDTDSVDGMHAGHGGPADTCADCVEFNNHITELKNLLTL